MPGPEGLEAMLKCSAFMLMLLEGFNQANHVMMVAVDSDCSDCGEETEMEVSGKSARRLLIL